jgi:zinc protease
MIKNLRTLYPLGVALALIAGLGTWGSSANFESEAIMNSMQDTFQLANGLTVITKSVPAVPVVSVYIWYKVGSRNEPGGKSGMAHFLEHMMFKGTEKFPKGEITRRVGRTGGEQNAFTSYDYTAYYETMPAEYLELGLEIEADRMHHALLDPQELESERTVILSELEGNRNHPQTRLRDLVNAQTWQQHPYRRPVIGWREDVQRLSATDLREFYQRYYRPNNATLVVVGDFKPAELRQSIERWFGPISGGTPAPAFANVMEVQQGERRVVLRDHGQTPMLRLQIRIPEAGKPDQYTLTVLNEVLANGKTARLYKALVDTGLAADVSASPQEMIEPGVWVFNVICQPGVDPAKVEAVMKKEFSKIAHEPLTPREFQRAVNQTRAQLIYAKDSISDQAMLLGFYQTVAGDWRIADQYPAQVAAVTPAQIQAAAEKFLNPDLMTFGCFIPLPGKPAGSLTAAEGKVSWKTSPDRLAALESLPVLPEGSSAAGAISTTACERWVMPNGMVVLLQPNHSNPTVSLSGLIKAGIVSEPSGIPGLATVHANMLDRGTQQHTMEQLSEELEFHAVRLSHNAGYEELNLSGEALSENAELLLASLAETLLQPAFPKGELEKVRKEVLTSVRMAQDNANSQAWYAFNQLAYPAGHPMTRSLISAEPGIRKIKRADLVAYHAQWIRPDLTVLSIAGDIDPVQVKVWLAKLFGTWAVNGPKPSNAFTPMPAVVKSSARTVELPGKRESITVLGHEGIQRQDPEYYDAYLANHILGGSGLSSRLMKSVRDRDGLTYSVYSQFKLSTNVRPWIVQFQSDPAKVEQAKQTILREIQDLQSNRVNEQEVDDGREELVGSLLLTLETNQGIAHLNREVEYHQLGADYLKRYPVLIRAVTRDRLVNAARKWLHPDRYLAVTVQPPATEISQPQGQHEAH